MSDNLVIGGATFTGVTGIKATDTSDNTVTYMSGGYTADDFLDGTKPTGAVSSEATSFATYRMRGRVNVTSISIPNATSISDGFAYGCTNLANIYAPNATVLGVPALRGTALEYLVLPKCGKLNGQYCFHDNTHLKGVDLGGTYAGTALNSYYMSNNSLYWEALVLRSTTMWALTNIAAFTYSRFAKTAGGAPATGLGSTLYVPKSLVSTYKSATNWATILGYTNNMILPIEGSKYETEYADGTQISGSVSSDPTYFMGGWAATSSNGTVPYIQKSADRGLGINLRGDHPIRFNSVSGRDSALYPIPVPNGKVSVTLTSNDLDIAIIELSHDGTDWHRLVGSGWLLYSGGATHTYTISNNGTTHVYYLFRQAGMESGGTVTDTMAQAVTVSWQ